MIRSIISQLSDYPKFCTSRRRILFDFFFSRNNWFSSQKFSTFFTATTTNCHLRRANALFSKISKIVFYNSVFKRMKSNNTHFSTRFQTLKCIAQSLWKPLQFTIDSNPQSLKSSSSRVNLTIPEGTQSGTTFRIRGKGIPYVRGNGRGDQFVTVNIRTPKNLTSSQKELLRQFAASMGDLDGESGKSIFGKKKR